MKAEWRHELPRQEAGSNNNGREIAGGRIWQDKKLKEKFGRDMNNGR